VEIHLPISPTEHFFTMVHYFAASLRLNGGSLGNSRIVVTVGADQEPEDLYDRLPWSRRYAIEWHWLDRGLFREHTFYATALERFRLPFKARTVMMVDADMLVAAPFVELAQEAADAPALAGLIAHVSPFLSQPSVSAVEWWTRLFAEARLGPPPLICEHTGWGVMFTEPTARYCPPYFNLGLLVAPPEIMTRLGKVIYAEMEAVNRVLKTHFRCQLALTLAVARTQVGWRAVPMRYNFPNDEQIESKYRAELADVRLLHYLRVGPFQKARDVQNAGTVREFLRRNDLSGVNALLQAHLARVHRRVVEDDRWKEASEPQTTR
jgi:hypothetical protein